MKLLSGRREFRELIVLTSFSHFNKQSQCPLLFNNDKDNNDKDYL